MIASEQPVGNLGATLAGGIHACAFFDGPEDEYRVLLPFTQDCLNCGEKCLNFLDPLREQERFRRLAEGTINTDEAVASGQLEVRRWEDSSLRGNRFDQEDMLAVIRDAMADGRTTYRRTRLWANMEWSLSGLPGCDQLVEYESRLNTLLERSEDIVLCVYDARKYGATLVMDILCTHPMVIVGEFVRPNPLYVPTQTFLPDYRQRCGVRRP